MSETLLVSNDGELQHKLDTVEAFVSQNGHLIPIAHLLLFSPTGEVYTQCRSSKKQILANQEIPFAAGGRCDSRDLHAGTGKEEISYRKTIIREGQEEIGINLRRNDLRKVHNLPEILDLGPEGRFFARVYHAIYDPQRHGEFNVDPYEVSSSPLLKNIDEIEKITRKVFPSIYSDPLIQQIRELSIRIKSSK